MNERQIVAIGGGGFSAGYAAENQVALHFRGRERAEAVTWRTGGRAFRVERAAAGGVETPLPPRALG